MKKNLAVIFTLFLLISSFIGNAQSAQKANQIPAPNKIEAYYFHLSSRCVTCKAVEAEAKKNLESLYGDKVTFQAINLEEDANNALAAKLKISGQTLLIVKGNKQINLTNEGFMYALNNPEKFKTILKTKVDGLLK